MTQRLKLGPLPSTEMTKLTLTMPVALRDELERYARLHAEGSGGRADLTRLIPHMLAAFMHGDRAFRRAARRPTAADVDSSAS